MPIGRKFSVSKKNVQYIVILNVKSLISESRIYLLLKANFTFDSKKMPSLNTTAAH